MLSVIASCKVLSKKPSRGPLRLNTNKGQCHIEGDEDTTGQLLGESGINDMAAACLICRIDLPTASRNARLEFSIRCQRSTTCSESGKAFAIASP